MSTQFGKDLKIYSDRGLRTVEDWKSLGREVQAGSSPRADAPYRGETVPLFTRDQTRSKPSSR